MISEKYGLITDISGCQYLIQPGRGRERCIPNDKDQPILQAVSAGISSTVTSKYHDPLPTPVNV